MEDMIFNDITFDSLLKVENIRRSMMPPREVKKVKRPTYIGDRLSRVEMPGTTIEVDVRMYTDNIRSTRDRVRQVAALLNTTAPVKLILRDQPLLYNMAILSGETEMDRLLTSEETTLSFYCADPFAYPLINKTISIGATTTVINNGAEAMPGIFTITADKSTTFLRLNHYELGEYIYVKHNFVSGDIIVIDLEKESVYKNGLSIMEDVYLESDFFRLPKGESTLNLNNGTGILVFREGEF